MKKVLLSIAAVAAIGAAVPAAAQTYGYNSYGGYNQNDYGRYDRDSRGYGRYGGAARLDQREASLAARINAAARNGEITRYEASRLIRDLGLINGLELQYRRNGMNGWEVAGINERLENLSNTLERARGGDNPYGGGRYSNHRRW